VNIHSKKDDPNADRDLYSGLIRLHVLHHTVKAPVFGLRMLEELASHGYRISPGTLYPLLHGWKERDISTRARNEMENLDEPFIVHTKR